MTTDAVVKVGGSLLESGSLPSLLTTLGELARTHRLVVVPGGGPFADAVRAACSLDDPGASTAHWMAILAMDQHAHLLAGLLPAAKRATGPEEIAKVQAEGLLPVLAPYRWLEAVDPLPHGWHVTSDSIAAWVAARLGARRLVLLKSLEGVPGTNGEVLAELPLSSPALAGIVDEYFQRAVEPGLECWVLSGREPQRLSELLREGRTRGTRLVGGRGRRGGFAAAGSDALWNRVGTRRMHGFFAVDRPQPTRLLLSWIRRSISRRNP